MREIRVLIFDDGIITISGTQWPRTTLRDYHRAASIVSEWILAGTAVTEDYWRTLSIERSYRALWIVAKRMGVSGVDMQSAVRREDLDIARGMYYALLRGFGYSQQQALQPVARTVHCAPVWDLKHADRLATSTTYAADYAALREDLTPIMGFEPATPPHEQADAEKDVTFPDE